MRLLMILLLILPWPAMACAPDKDYVPILARPNQGLLYKLEKCDEPVQYLFGTFHSDSKDLVPLADTAGHYIRQSSHLNLEIVLTELDQKRAQQFMLLPSGSPDLQTLVGNEMFAKIRQKLLPLIGLPYTAAQRYQPWAIAVLAQYPKPEADGVVLDSRLHAIADAAGVPVSGLEDVDDQFEIFTDMSKQEQYYFLEHTIENSNNLPIELLELKRLYLNRDLTGIFDLSREVFDELAEKDEDLAEYLEEELITLRNKRMVSEMSRDFDATSFTAVGALHLPGRNGMLHLLEQRGWMITALDE